MLDPVVVALMDKSETLKIRSAAAGFTCRLCGVEQEAHAWRVSLPEMRGPACPGCASDRGWTVG